MRIILAAILTAAIATPAAAHYVKSSDSVTIKKHRAHGAYAYVVAPRHVGTTNDVYVDGKYVGTDPDWRVRETIRRENIGNNKL